MIIELGLVGVGAVVGYGFRGKIARLIATVKTFVSKETASAKLALVTAKRKAVEEAIAIEKAAVADVHTAIADIDSKL